MAEAKFNVKSRDTDHKDLILDVAFDFYGTRMATCSVDHTVKIWDLKDGEWVCTNLHKKHRGPVWRVSWAHPEFGQIIATCSFDHTVVVWEENVKLTVDGIQNTWVLKATLHDSRTRVTDVKFAPKCMGLQVAFCSADGVVRIFEASDVMDISQWQHIHEINVKPLSCSCLSWNPVRSRLQPPLLAVGSDLTGFTSGGKVAVYEFQEKNRKWHAVESLLLSAITEPVHDLAFAPNIGRSYSLLAIAAKDVRILSFRPAKPDQNDNTMSSSFELTQAGHIDHGSTVWRLSWNMTGTILASSGDDGRVRLSKANHLNIWKFICTLQGDSVESAGEDSEGGRMISSPGNTSQISHNAARYFKLAPTAHPSHVPWH